MKLVLSLVLAGGALICLLYVLRRNTPEHVASPLAQWNSASSETNPARVALEASEPSFAEASTTNVTAPAHDTSANAWKKSGGLTQAEIDYRLTELQKMQAVFEHALLEPGQYQIGRATMFFGMCMAYTLDARGEAIIVPEGVTYTYPPEVPGVWHCSFDGRFYSFLAAEFPEQSQIKALRAEHETWMQAHKAGEAIGPEPTVHPALITSLLEKASKASMELKAGRPK